MSDDTDTQILLFAEFLKLITLLLIIMQKNIKIFVYIEVVYLPKVGSVSTPYLKVIFFRLLLVSVMVYMLIIIPIVFRLLTALCFLRNPLPATHMYIIHIQPTPDFRECIRLTMLICYQKRQEDAPTSTPANIMGCD